DRDLAALYGVTTAALNQAVKRNAKRFPGDFMFQLSVEEMKNWMSQIVISKSERMGLRKRPLVFTEQGVAMLSGVLKSDRAIQVNIQIIRTFTRIRELLATNEALQRKVTELERTYDGKIREIFATLKFLLPDNKKPKREIGFRIRQ
ncbi:MAG: ORF6N domain-containing protein, partial [Candidatus Saccharimonadales bacterium]